MRSRKVIFFFSSRDSGLSQIQPRRIHLQHNQDETRPGISEHILLVWNTLSAGILITLSNTHGALLTLRKCSAIISRNGGNNRISLLVKTLIYDRGPERKSPIRSELGPSQTRLQACGMRSCVRNVDTERFCSSDFTCHSLEDLWEGDKSERPSADHLCVCVCAERLELAFCVSFATLTH